MDLHPIEIMASSAFIIVLLLVTLFLPKKVRKLALAGVGAMLVLLLVLFAVRPYYIDHQVALKTEQLDQHLQDRYPGESWEISRQEGRHNNPYRLQVRFSNEQDWIYIYRITEGKPVCQTSWVPPEGKFPDAGKHYESCS
ncbi:hypothetical protein [Paenibacillus sp. 1P07SE]|uniref:hypothetical protein n=1 Tax=Paenibacillus sp. 1P07SE TaxID=3132209 RepID=UPI0039A58E2D